MAGYGSGRGEAAVTALHAAPVFEPAAYARRALQLLEAARKELGDEVELLHDVHERLSPTQAVGFCKDVEHFRLFFLEDPVSPEDIGWFRLIRQQCATPLAMGELFNSPHEWIPLISERLIDYIRVHVSQAGGSRRAARWPPSASCSASRRPGTGPATSRRSATPATSPSTSPAPTSASRSPRRFNDATREVFSGCPELRDGYFYANEAPGWGIEVDERAAAKYPFGHGETGERQRLNGGWGEIRRRDGTLIKQ